MALIELTHYVLAPEKNGRGIGPSTLRIGAGEILSVQSDSVNDTHLLIKGLATLSYPVSGTYLFQGEALDFSDYRNLLNTKKQLGYLTSSSALISNRSIRDNLCIGQVYFGNDLSAALSESAMDLCREFGIHGVLDERPVGLGAFDNKRAMVIRELMKKPRLMLVEYPEMFSGHRYMDHLIRIFKAEIHDGMALVFVSGDQQFNNAFPGNHLEIKGGSVEIKAASPTLGR